jgi:hypothetical protein
VTGHPRPNFRMAKLLFLKEASASFEYTHTRFATKKRSAQVSEGDATIARR